MFPEKSTSKQLLIFLTFSDLDLQTIKVQIVKTFFVTARLAQGITYSCIMKIQRIRKYSVAPQMVVHIVSFENKANSQLFANTTDSKLCLYL